MARVVARAALAALITCTALATGSSAAERTNRIKDPRNDVEECESGARADRSEDAADIREVRVRSDGTIQVRMDRSVRSSLDREFSFAILILVETPDGTARAFLVEVHDGAVIIGEVDPQTGAPLPEGPPVEIDGTRVRVNPGGDVPAGTTITVQGFNTPVEGDAKLCDEAILELGDDVEPKASIEPPPLEPPRSGDLGQQDLEEILL